MGSETSGPLRSMAFERLRLFVGAMSWLGAGALAAMADSSARTWVGAVVLLVAGLALTFPLAKRPPPPVPIVEPAPSPDAQRLVVLQSLLEHMPVAAWLQTERNLQPLSSRARRLQAPGGIRDPNALKETLRTSERGGALVLDTERGNERWQLQRQALSLDGKAHVLLVLVPLEQELESESLRAWQQLLQVLTHEIMNSLTPIKSLSQTASGLISEPDSQAELRTALNAIARRAESLSNFVTTYRQVTKWPTPTLAPVDLQDLFKRLHQSVGPEWTARGGAAAFDVASPSLRLMADEGHLEQVLLALIRNAEQATESESRPQLWVEARQSRGGRLQISVRDNGPGVPAGLEKQIFLPFFSAREGGQGIGLTVARQLTYGMGGRIRHVRPFERGAEFVLIF
jgi:signal transduction histidine kinase